MGWAQSELADRVMQRLLSSVHKGIGKGQGRFNNYHKNLQLLLTSSDPTLARVWRGPRCLPINPNRRDHHQPLPISGLIHAKLGVTSFAVIKRSICSWAASRMDVGVGAVNTLWFDKLCSRPCHPCTRAPAPQKQYGWPACASTSQQTQTSAAVAKDFLFHTKSWAVCSSTLLYGGLPLAKGYPPMTKIKLVKFAAALLCASATCARGRARACTSCPKCAARGQEHAMHTEGPAPGQSSAYDLRSWLPVIHHLNSCWCLVNRSLSPLPRAAQALLLPPEACASAGPVPQTVITDWLFGSFMGCMLVDLVFVGGICAQAATFFLLSHSSGVSSLVAIPPKPPVEAASLYDREQAASPGENGIKERECWFVQVGMCQHRGTAENSSFWCPFKAT